ncbi:MAG: hypothetical protein H0V89_05675 [Deltaproteobacteria bacterium]|nr:hypothetical protein [Deltaproteobacteria bacterium]
MSALGRSRALWNRSAPDLRSDEVLAQILDRGEVAAWRELYALAAEDAALRARIHSVIQRVPLWNGRFWLAALASLGDAVDLGESLPPER